MGNYSIVRIGNAYVVQAEEKGVLIIASRRRAARLVSDAAELLVSHAAPHSATSAARRAIQVIPEIIAATRDHTDL
jgi:hypothetical protein